MSPNDDWERAKILNDVRKLGLNAYEELILYDRTLREAGLAFSDEGESEIDSQASGHAGRAPPDSDDESFGSKADYVSDGDSDEDIPQTIQVTKPDFLRYSRADLISMIPEGSRYDKCRIDACLSRVSMRYDPELSNRQFKRVYLRKHRSLASLKYLPKYRVVLTGLQIVDMVNKKSFPLTVRNPPFGGKPIRPKVLKRPQIRVYQNTNKGEVTHLVLKGNFRNRFPRGDKAPVKGAKKLPKIGKVSRAGIASIIGGVSFTTKPPDPRHKKYWYFFRKRGTWSLSKHHPLGDEDEVYNLKFFG